MLYEMVYWVDDSSDRETVRFTMEDGESFANLGEILAETIEENLDEINVISIIQVK